MIFTARIVGLTLLVAAPASAAPVPADEGYDGARSAYRALKGDAARRKFRHNWLNVAKKFEAVAARFPKSPRAPEALFTTGELLAELSRFSGQDSDLDAAVLDFQKLVSGYPKHRLADDAALALARIAVDRRDDVTLARSELERGLAANPQGDRARDLKALLASLPAEAAKTPESDASAGARAAASKASPELDTSAKVHAAASKSVPDPDASARTRSFAAKSPPVTDASVKAHAVASKPVPDPDASAKVREPTRASTETVAEAIAKLSAKLKPPPSEQPADADEPEADAPRPPVPTLERVQERLRSVRVGSAADEPARRVDEKAAKERLRRVAKDERESEVTLAEQLGLKVRRVVIDAGHGGHDTGAVGAKGTREKDVTLAIAQRLSELLTVAGLEVVLTRDADTFVRLEDRVRIANEARGDLFISVHCNSAPGSRLRGVETYTLNTSSDRYSIRLAARENASSEKGLSDLQFILADLATKANTEESSRLASKVQHGLVASLGEKHRGVRDLGNKEALFYVLLGAKMPSVLVETSFLSNPDEEQLLASPEYQEEISTAIAASVQEFLGDRLRLAKVD